MIWLGFYLKRPRMFHSIDRAKQFQFIVIQIIYYYPISFPCFVLEFQAINKCR